MDVGKGRGKKVAKGSWNGSLSFPNRHWSPDAVVCLFNEFIAVNNFLIIRKVKIRFPDFVFDLYFNIPLTFATLIFRIMYFIGRIFFFPFFSKESVSHPFRMATNKFLNIRIGSKFFSKISSFHRFSFPRKSRRTGEWRIKRDNLFLKRV